MGLVEPGRPALLATGKRWRLNRSQVHGTSPSCVESLSAAACARGCRERTAEGYVTAPKSGTTRSQPASGAALLWTAQLVALGEEWRSVSGSKACAATLTWGRPSSR